MKVPAVILAGGRDKGPLAEATGQPIRGLVSIAGRSMASYVADALRGCESVGEVVAVGPPELEAALPGVRLLPEGPDLLSNILTGLSAFSTNGPVLLLTVDIPFLTPQALEDFITRAREADADACYPILRHEACLSQFPGMKRTSVRLKEGRFTGGNMMLVKSEFFRKMEPMVSEAYGLRKKPLKLARRVGFTLLILLMLGRLRVSHAEAKIGKLLGGTVRAIMSDYAEIGADVDKPEDLTTAETLLTQVQRSKSKSPRP